MLLLVCRANLFQQLSMHPMNQQESPCCHNLLTVTSSYHNNVTPIGALRAEKIAVAVWLCEFTIAFTASLGGGCECYSKYIEP